MRNLGYSIFDIFLPISIAVFIMGLFFLFFLIHYQFLWKVKYDNKIR